MQKNNYFIDEYNPHPGQKLLHEATEKEIIVVSSIRSGKSYAIIFDVIINAWNNPTENAVLVCGPVYRLLEKVLEREIVNKLLHMGLLQEHSYSRHETTLKNGKTILYRALEKPDIALRGLNIWRAYVDEFSYTTKYAIDVLKGRLLTSDGTLIMICTPNGTGSWVYEEYISTKKPNVRYIEFNLRDNPIITEEAISRYYASLDKLMAQQELEGKWVNLYQDRVYFGFEEGNIGTYKYEDDKQVYVSVDYNIDKNSWQALQRMPNNTFKVISEEYGARTTSDLSYQILKKYGKEVIIIPDASGGFRLQGTATTHFDIMRQAGLNNIIENRKNPDVSKRIAVANAAFTNGLNQHRVFIDKSCTQTIRELNTLAYMKTTNKIDTLGEKVGHRTSALTYGIFYLVGERVGSVIEPKKDFVKDFRQRVQANDNFSI